MIVFIKLLDRSLYQLETNDNYTISYLKIQIQETLKIHKDVQRLIFNGYTLLDENTLKQYHISDKSTIFLLLQMI